MPPRGRSGCDRPTPAWAQRSPPGGLPIASFHGFRKPCQFDGYEFGVNDDGAWRLVGNGPHRVLLGAGHVQPRLRYALRLVADGRILLGFVGRQRAARLRLKAPITGLAGLGSFSFDRIRFDRFTVTPIASTMPMLHERQVRGKRRRPSAALAAARSQRSVR